MKTNKFLFPSLIAIVVIFFALLSIEYVNIQDRIDRLQKNDQEIERVIYQKDTIKLVELKSGVLSVIEIK